MPRQDQRLKARARLLRKSQTPAEQKLWLVLRARRFAGVKFVRQFPIGPYIIDFAARACRLLIEIDGDTHVHQLAYDARRTAFLERQGYRVIRFTNAEVTGNIDGVAEVIARQLASTPLPTLSPPGRGLSSPLSQRSEHEG